MRFGYRRDAEYYFLRDKNYMNVLFRVGDKAVDLHPLTKRRYYQNRVIGNKSDLPGGNVIAPEVNQEKKVDIMPKKKSKSKKK